MWRFSQVCCGVVLVAMHWMSGSSFVCRLQCVVERQTGVSACACVCVCVCPCLLLCVCCALPCVLYKVVRQPLRPMAPKPKGKARAKAKTAAKTGVQARDAGVGFGLASCLPGQALLCEQLEELKKKKADAKNAVKEASKDEKNAIKKRNRLLKVQSCPS